MNSTFRLCGVLLCAASLSACATITRGTRQDYVIETDPAGAQIALSTGQTCTSPCNLRLKRKNEFFVTATMDGYEPARAEVTTAVRAGGVAGVAGNVLVGGIIGAVVDGTNGSMNDLRPNPLRITMVPIAGATPVADEAAPVAATEAPAVEEATATAATEPVAVEAPAEAPPAVAAPATAPSPTDGAD